MPAILSQFLLHCTLNWSIPDPGNSQYVYIYYLLPELEWNYFLFKSLAEKIWNFLWMSIILYLFCRHDAQFNLLWHFVFNFNCPSIKCFNLVLLTKKKRNFGFGILRRRKWTKKTSWKFWRCVSAFLNKSPRANFSTFKAFGIFHLLLCAKQ